MKKSYLLCGYLLLISLASAQGPLAPPGAPAPLMKTLDQVEPRTPVNAVNTPGDTNALYVISQSGSYYLTGDVLGVPDKHGIRIDADYVTLDLNGYTLDGVIGSLSGIETSEEFLRALTIRNGSVRYWGEYGANVVAGTLILDRVRAEGNTAGGFRQSGNAGLTLNCAAINNGGIGFEVFHAGILDGCVSRNNLQGFVSRDAGLHASNCEATGNTTYGIGPTDFYSVHRFWLIRDSLFADNPTHNINLRANTYLERVVARHNSTTATAIRLQGMSRIRDVEVHSSDVGLDIRNHDFPGQWANAYITGAHAVSNSIRGVWIATRRSRVQDSTMLGGGGNDLRMGGGSDFSIAFGNHGTGGSWWFHTNTFGRAVIAPASAAVSGDAGGAGLGTTDPWVNISQ